MTDVVQQVQQLLAQPAVAQNSGADPQQKQEGGAAAAGGAEEPKKVSLS